ncbi:MAG: shikimate dehydrogenase [Oscillatoriales cyanobacterium RM2_1_1]|nr:shikimate dehydrogenase [Oscillatoriales cyanobacterium SM2_3_0]NJO47392.1 shikimate dehydrogenase [Oscillatoriales cyanobacterium RM2_1_1]
MIQGTTKLLGVIGDPIQHSLSPVMHNAAIAHLAVDYVYLPFPVKGEALLATLDGFRAIGLVGFNVTIPHKQAIFPLLTEISPLAQALGAVNTVWQTDQGWAGTNTDVAGFLAPLRKFDWTGPGKSAVILGNGGASRAVVAGCAMLGISQIHVVGRSWEKLTIFQRSWQQLKKLENPEPVSFNPVIPQIHLWEALPPLIEQTDLLVNTTPVGMSPEVGRSPLEPALIRHLAPKTIVYDLIYTPRPTRLLQMAQAQGAIPIDGLEMLVQQGAAALELWLGQSAPIEIMAQALLQKLER